MVWQPPNRLINPVVFILLLLALVSTAGANSVSPPGGITICGYVTYANEIGIWWFNPYDPDFGGVQMWLDDEYLGTTGAADHFFNAYSAVVGTHTFSTHTFDNSGNVNTTWVNLTFLTKEYPGCTENWTCETCSPPIPPVAAFSANPTSGFVPLAVLFTDNSTNIPTSWNWSFGDGSYSPARNPLHTYLVNGTFTVSLNATNSAGSNTATRLNYIIVSTSPTVTPTLISSDSDTPRFVPSTGGATESGARAGERITVPFAGNLEADDSVPVVVVAITVVPSIDIQGFMASAIKAPAGLTMTIPGNPPAYYLDISIQWIREDVVKEVEIMFSIDDGWLKEQGITPEDVVMMQYHESTWSELPTRMEKYSDGRYYYAATTSGFSYFAVTRKGAGAPSTTPTLTSLVTITQQVISGSTTSATSRPVISAVRTKTVTTTTTVPPVSYTGSPEFPTLWIVFGVAGFAGIFLIVFIRRWWIRRQNPALFRKYE
jgi:PGF-pre-PGF domain-containing protein